MTSIAAPSGPTRFQIATIADDARMQRVEWCLRIAAAGCFIGHGAFGIITKASWVPFFAVVVSKSVACCSGQLPAHSAPLIIPASLQAPQTVAVADYLKAFNTGDSTTMRQYFERSVVPNASRTMGQRLDAFAQLKAALGTLSIVSVENSDPTRVVVTANGRVGARAALTFTIEGAAPYRVVSITIGYPAER